MAARFEFETSQTREASGPRFAEFTTWLRDTKTGEAYSFTGRTREQARNKAIAKAEEIKPPMQFSFACGSSVINAV